MTKEKTEGTVTRGHGNRFVVFSDGRFFSCQVRGKVKFCADQATPVAVGDDVTIEITGDDSAVIEAVHPRRTTLSRPTIAKESVQHVLAANIDSLVIVTSVNEPPLKPTLIDRFIIAGEAGGLRPAIIINKIDLGAGPAAEEIARVYQGLGYDLFMTCAIKGIGLDRLSDFLRDHRSLLAGHSGVGKSTILNRLLPGINLKVSEVSASTGKGRHTTSYMEMFTLPDGGFVIDSPGIKVLGLWQVEKTALGDHYPEISRYAEKCRFTGCSHIHEPDCAVREAVERGDISTVRYDNYVQIYRSL